MVIGEGGIYFILGMGDKKNFKIFYIDSFCFWTYTLRKVMSYIGQNIGVVNFFSSRQVIWPMVGHLVGNLNACKVIQVIELFLLTPGWN